MRKGGIVMVNASAGYLYIFWDEKTNRFYDPCGIRIANIHEYITPRDSYMFRANPKEFCIFSLIDDPNILCIIICDEDMYP